MKKIYSLLTLVAAMVCLAQTAAAGTVTWTYGWPVSSTKDGGTGYANGFYNFGGTYEANLTSQTRTLGGKEWTMTFEAGTKLAYTTTSGQSIGASGGFTKTFTLESDDFEGKIKSITLKTRTKVADSKLTATVGGKNYLCGGEAEVSYTVASGTTPLTLKFEPDANGAQEGKILLSFAIPQTSSNHYVKEISVEYEEVEPAVAAPVISKETGSYDEAFDVTISGPEGADILYTLDGSNPKTGGEKYTGAIHIDKNCTLKAVATNGTDFSKIAEAEYIIRVSPELSLVKDSYTIELLEEAVLQLNNPHNVALKYSSSDPNVAAYYEGVIYTYHPGTAVITISFAGDANYLPQTLKANVEVVAKDPLTGLTMTPMGGDYTEKVKVKVTCTDPKAVTIWYHIGKEAAKLDDLGIIEDYQIHQSTTLELELDDACVLTVQAMGNNVWSEPISADFNIKLPLKAAFKGPKSVKRVYHNGFDSEADLATWETSTGSEWQLKDGQIFSNTPLYTAINPDSKYSLYHKYSSTGETSVITSPTIEIPAEATLRFHAIFNPVWLVYGDLKLYVTEDADGAEPQQVWSAFMTAQEAATDDINWTEYSVDLSAYAGKKVYFAFGYKLDGGKDVAIDDFEVVVPDGDGNTVNINAGNTVSFTDLSEGKPESWLWTLPGSVEGTSNEQNPKVRYNTPGTYDVTLTVSRGEETSTFSIPAYVNVKAVAPKAAIGIPQGVYYSPEAGLVVPTATPLTFTDASVWASAWKWTLPGTDLASSTEKDVTVKYTTEGTFDVDLEVTNEVGKSSTYIYGVKAGGESLAWNISAAENTKLAGINLSYYGYYGGTNWLGMLSFAEAFEAPVVPVEISSVNIYFAGAKYVSTDAQITVSIATPGADGMPGEVVATTSLPVSELVDASETYNDPTVFRFDTPVEVEGKYFVTVEGFPNAYNNDGEDAIYMYALRRGGTEHNTAYHLLEADDYSEGGWVAQTDDPTSFAIAPKIKYLTDDSGINGVEADADADAEAEYYNLQGMRVTNGNLTPGIYIVRQGTTTAKKLIR